MPQGRDMTKKAFAKACTERGFKRLPYMGYYAVGHGTHVSIWNAGKRRRNQLAYLIHEAARIQEKHETKNEQLCKGEE